MAYTYDEDTGVYTVDFSELDSLLVSLPYNTKENVYKLNITGTTAGDYRRNATFDTNGVGYKLKFWGGNNDKQKFFDLSATTIPSDIVNMEYCFSGCITLVRVPNIPSSVKILRSAFEGCSSLIECPEIPNGVINMEYCFDSCSSIIETPYIPSSVTDMHSCFNRCTKLVKVTNIPNSVANLSSCFAWCKSIKELPPIPSSVTNLSSCFFSGVIDSVSIYGDISQKEIGSMFSFVNTVYVSYNSVSYLEANRSLAGLYLGVPIIGKFISVTDLNSYLESLPENTAETAYSIEIVETTGDDYSDSTTEGTVGYILKQHLTKYVDLSSSVIPNTIDDMKQSFSGCKNLVKSPVIPNGVKTLERCFVNNNALIEAPIIPDSVTNMSQCFMACRSLATAPKLPSSVTNLYRCFYSSSLTVSPVIPDSVTEISYCFYNCKELETVKNLPDNKEVYLYYTSLFGGCSSLKEIPPIPKCVKNIQSCFSGCTSLKEVRILSKSISAVGGHISNAFINSSVEKLYVPLSEYNVYSTDDTSRLKEDADIIGFCETSELKTSLGVLNENTVETAYKIELSGFIANDFATSGNIARALWANENKYVDLSFSEMPDNLVGGMFATFQHCTTLVKSIKFPNITFTQLNSVFVGCTSLIEAPVMPDCSGPMSGCFMGCTSLKKAPYIPNSVTSITQCFSGCTSLEEIQNLPVNATDMRYCFQDCAIETIDLKDVSPTTASYMFKNCTKLKTITNWNIPMDADVTGIFDGCTSLERVELANPLPASEKTKTKLVLVKQGADKVEITAQELDSEESKTLEVATTLGKQTALFEDTDEIRFSENITVEDFNRIFGNKYKWIQKEGSVGILNPDNPNFVLWAKDKNFVISNFLNGGGGSLSKDDIIELSLKMSGTVGELRYFPDKQPHAGFKYADGSIFLPEVYPEFFEWWKKTLEKRCGYDSNGYPKLPDLRGRHIRGAYDYENIFTSEREMLPNLTGNFGTWNQWAGSRVGDGVFYSWNYQTATGFGSSGNDARTATNIDASRAHDAYRQQQRHAQYPKVKVDSVISYIFIKML